MKPKIIAWSKGLTVIPFENVLAVAEDGTTDGQLVVELNSPNKDGATVILGKDDAPLFVEQYNIYLATVEGLTMTMRIVPDNGDQS